MEFKCEPEVAIAFFEMVKALRAEDAKDDKNQKTLEVITTGANTIENIVRSLANCDPKQVANIMTVLSPLIAIVNKKIDGKEPVKAPIKKEPAKKEPVGKFATDVK